jgi:hypothetical protein
MGATISDNSNNKLSFEILRILSAFYINDVCVGVDGGKKEYMYFRKTVGEVPSRFLQNMLFSTFAASKRVSLVIYTLIVLSSPTSNN